MTESGGTIYYDGECGLCHGWVKFVLPRDPAGRFRFEPLQSTSLEVDEPFLSTMLVRTSGGELLKRSDGVLYVLRQLGGTWGLAAMMLGVIPRSLRDLGYRIVASVRRGIFRTPSDLCPVVPPEWRDRFPR